MPEPAVICPLCRRSLTGDDVMLVEVPLVYDGALFGQCLFCQGMWHRFPPGHPVRVRAEAYLALTSRDAEVAGSPESSQERS